MKVPRGLWKYLAGAAAARAGDEMSGPALLLLGFAITGRPGTGSEVLAGLTIAAAVGGPAFGAVLDRSPRPDRVLAVTLAAYALGLVALQAALGHLPVPLVVVVALAAGLFSPAVAGGWSAQLPRIVTGPGLARASALDSMSFSAASLAGPALAALIAAALGARWAVLTAAALVGLAVPGAISLARYRPPQGAVRVQSVYRQVAAGFAVIATRRPLLRATVTSVVSFVGLGMLLVCVPVLGAHRLGGAPRGALLISAMAAASLIANALLARWPPRGQPDAGVLVSTLVIGASMAATAFAAGWLTVLAIAVGGGRRGAAADVAARGQAPGDARTHARAGLHHGGEPEDRRVRRRRGARGPAGRAVRDRLPARRGRLPAVRRGGLPPDRIRGPGTGGDAAHAGEYGDGR